MNPAASDQAESAAQLPEADHRITREIPTMWLYLALHLHFPVWTNDHDFEESGVEWHTTAELLKMLRIESG